MWIHKQLKEKSIISIFHPIYILHHLKVALELACFKTIEQAQGCYTNQQLLCDRSPLSKGKTQGAPAALTL